MKTLGALQEHFYNLYEMNNRMFLPSFRERLDHLDLMASRLQRSIRKDESKEKLEKRIANMIAWTMSVANYFKPFSPLDDAMSGKYPKGVCGYCQGNPCSCEQGQRDAHLFNGKVEQLDWSLRDHQENLNALYGEINRQQGIDNTLNRLFSEFSEIREIEAGAVNVNVDASRVCRAYMLEISDVLAWILAIASILDIDAQSVIEECYGQGCPACDGKKRCKCPKYVHEHNVIYRRSSVGSRPDELGLC